MTWTDKGYGWMLTPWDRMGFYRKLILLSDAFLCTVMTWSEAERQAYNRADYWRDFYNLVRPITTTVGQQAILNEFRDVIMNNHWEGIDLERAKLGQFGRNHDYIRAALNRLIEAGYTP